MNKCSFNGNPAPVIRFMQFHYCTVRNPGTGADDTHACMHANRRACSTHGSIQIINGNGFGGMIVSGNKEFRWRRMLYVVSAWDPVHR